MGMCVRHITSGEQERDPGHGVDVLQCPRKLLADLDETPGRGRRKIIETGVVLARDELDVFRADRVRAEERHRKLVLVDQVRRKGTGCNAAEYAIRHEKAGRTNSRASTPIHMKRNRPSPCRRR